MEPAGPAARSRHALPLPAGPLQSVAEEVVGVGGASGGGEEEGEEEDGEGEEGVGGRVRVSARFASQSWKDVNFSSYRLCDFEGRRGGCLRGGGYCGGASREWRSHGALRF